MAGNRIKGITVEISADTTKLQSALKVSIQKSRIRRVSSRMSRSS